MSTNEKIQIGDTVSLTGVVEDINGNWMDVTVANNTFRVEDATFVSRPEKTYTIELTAHEIYQLQSGCYSSADEKLIKLVRDNNL